MASGIHSALVALASPAIGTPDLAQKQYPSDAAST